MTTGLFSFSLECEETLQFVADSGLDVTKISVSDECVNISGNESSKTMQYCIHCKKMWCIGTPQGSNILLFPW